MENKEFSKQLENRTKKFAISIITTSISLPNTPEEKVLKNQITKSGTSIGEADRSRSKADFTNKIKIIYKEANEILALFTSIGKKLKLKAF